MLRYLVDAPPRNPFVNPFWFNVADFPTRAEALKYVQETFGG